MQLRKIFVAALPIIVIATSASFFLKSPFAKGENNYTETTYYLLTDHLGSVDVVLDDEGNVVERADYLPYGDDRLRTTSPSTSPSISPSTDYKFTGKEMDEETGLMYYGARYYDSGLGRFISFDPLLLNEGGKPLSSVLMNPQALNPYSYVTNNPVRFVDETGEYENDVHLDLTMFLAEQAGFSSIDALTIGIQDNFIDTDPSTEPGLNIPNYLSGTTDAYHFADSIVAETNLNNAIASQNIIDFGGRLHTYQDLFSHTMSPEEHALDSFLSIFLDSKDPDKTENNTAQAKSMAYGTFQYMRSYLRKQIDSKDSDALKTFDADTTEKWKAVESDVNTFIESKSEDKSSQLKKSSENKKK